MGKFKVGDRVVCNSDYDPGNQYSKGVTYTVRGIRREAHGGNQILTERDDKGSRDNGAPECMFDAVSPVRTVTRKEIVPGVYGKVEIGSQVLIPDCGAPWNKPTPAIDLSITGSLSAAELTAAIATLTAVRDALDDAVAPATASREPAEMAA